MSNEETDSADMHYLEGLTEDLCNEVEADVHVGALTSLDKLLSGESKRSYSLTKEDWEWLHTVARGQEI